MNVDDRLSQILKDRAPTVAPHEAAWQRIATAPGGPKTGWYVGVAAAAAAVAVVAGVTVLGPESPGRTTAEQRTGIAPVSEPDVPSPAAPTGTAPASPSPTAPAGAPTGRLVYLRDGQVRTMTFQIGPNGGSGTTLFDTSVSAMIKGFDGVDVTPDGTVVASAGVEACASGIHSESLGPARLTTPVASAAPIGGPTRDPLVAPRKGVSLRMATLHERRLAFVRGECSIPGPDQGNASLMLQNEQLVIRDLATGRDRVIGDAQGAGPSSRLSWAGGRYLVFTSVGIPGGLVVYDPSTTAPPLTAQPRGGCYWGPPAGRPDAAALAVVEVCDDGDSSRVVTFAISSGALTRDDVVMTARGEITWLDYDSTGTRLLMQVDGRTTLHDASGAKLHDFGRLRADQPVW